MQKIVIDTNVFVSSIIQRGYPYLIVNELFIEGKITLCISDEVLKEYYDVLKRRKFEKYIQCEALSNLHGLISFKHRNFTNNLTYFNYGKKTR